MSRAPMPSRLQVPESLEAQLLAFRRRVWTTKMAEALGVAFSGLLVAYLAVFTLDRLWDTPSLARAALALAAVALAAVVPLYLYRWIWRRRQLEQLARLLSRKLPRVGDQLLGILELAHSKEEQGRSMALCHAAIQQVAADAQQRDLGAAAPTTRHHFWSSVATGAFAVAVVLALIAPAAARNAWARLLRPFGDVPRYTFASLAPLGDAVVVAHGEPFTLTVRLDERSLLRPARGVLRLDRHPPLEATLTAGQYAFAAPPLLAAIDATLKVGDAVQTVRIEPKLRPELTALAADVRLPEYLGRPRPVEKDIRGGAIAVVRGSSASFTATASRALAWAAVDGRPHQPSGATITTSAAAVVEPSERKLEWQDRYGLHGKEPFKISVTAEDDEPPAVACDGLPRRRVVLESEQLPFEVTAHDDYGVREVGLEWRSVDHDEGAEPRVKGERLLGPGGCELAMLALRGTFAAKSLAIDPQPIEVRIFATDYYPDRPRTYSEPYLLIVLSPEEHAVWMTDQLSKWHRQSLEVRDRELRLYETNKQLRVLSAKELDEPQIRRQVESQAAAERANGRKLASLATAGEELLRQAARNSEIGVGHLERWAEMLGILQDISAQRMPSVADLLTEASQAKGAASQAPTASNMIAGQSRASAGGGQPSESPKGAQPPAPGMQIVDLESTQQPQDPTAGDGPSLQKNPTTPSLRLPQTTVMGQASNKKYASPTAQKIDEAVQEQKDLLAEFEKVADELNTVLANLEGSTLVKRLKAAARRQYRIAGDVGGRLEEQFAAVEERNAETLRHAPTGSAEQAGIAPSHKKQPAPEAVAPLLSKLADEELDSSRQVSMIMDDMQAYFERRRMVRFKTILDDMRHEDVIGNLRRLAVDLPREQGLSMAQCEYWSDAMDRWAEDLVDPACSGECPGCKSQGSLPPSIVLEVLKILEGEINLREETRVAEQARPGVKPERHAQQANQLSETQGSLEERINVVVERIVKLPDAEKEFANELHLLGEAAVVMHEAQEILAQLETGAPAIAAETEVIELLLRSKRINPNGGGGSGATPGGGGGGDTKDSALALLGAGLNQKEVRTDHGTSQAVGDAGKTLPEEYRAGLDEYFNQLESEPGDG